METFKVRYIRQRSSERGQNVRGRSTLPGHVVRNINRDGL